MPRMKNVNKVVTVCASGVADVNMPRSTKESSKKATAKRLASEIWDNQVVDPQLAAIVKAEPAIAECVECGSLGSQICAPDCTTQKKESSVLPVQNVEHKVVEVKMKKVRKTKSTVKPDFYKKYPHVVPGSVRDPSNSDLRDVTKSHGKVCDVKCVDCKKVFTINTQDAFQCVRCDECKVKRAKEHRSERSKKRSSRRK